MADISDVEQAIADIVTSILYPAGSLQASIIGVLCRVYRGWPNAATLNADLSAGVVNVTVITDNDSGRTTTRYLPEWQSISAVPGMAASTVSQTIRISGAPALGDLVGALIDGKPYVYRVQVGDTAGLIASNLAQLIQTNRPATAQGFTTTVPGARSIVVRVVCDHPSSFESRRQEKDLRIVCWCPTPSIRDSVASAIDLALTQISFLGLPDNTNARMTYANTKSSDQAQNALLYRRDLIYTVEYPTITVDFLPSMLFGASDINGNITYG
ncbi:MAG: hypothetical protein QOH05_1824 [Acetobacteraceae bacterium]|jgi:hypothetical protein|nr:hypothetical protein [Acetobacteraceae bacterium]